MSDFLSNPVIAQEDRPEISALADTVMSIMRDTSERRAQRHVQTLIERLLARVRAPGPFSVEQLVAELRMEGADTDMMVDVCIPAAARVLGALWCEDEVGFAEVTIGSARLQGLLSHLAPPWSVCSGDENSPAIAIVVPEGDTHTLGPHVVTAQLRRMGASVRILFGPSSATLVKVLQEDPYDGVFFSTSRESRLPAIAEMIRRIKSSSTTPPTTVVGGLVLDLVREEAEKTRADLVTNDAFAALRHCRGHMEKIALKAR